MAYLSAERVKEIRTQLKKEFPSFKFSITRDDCSGIKISILESNVDFNLGEATYKQANVYWIDRDFTGQAKEVLKRIMAIAHSGVKYYETGDYGNQPSFYVSINIGQWDKPYKQTGKEVLGMPMNYLPQPMVACAR
jgi:hypothetical protein